jgi:hypothetical protein
MNRAHAITRRRAGVFASARRFGRPSDAPGMFGTTHAASDGATTSRAAGTRSNGPAPGQIAVEARTQEALTR